MNIINNMNKDELLQIVLNALDKAVVDDVRVYDMTYITPYADYSVIASASNNRQGHAAIEYLKDEVSKLSLDFRVSPVDNDTTWFLIDVEGIVVHVFVGKERDTYSLDKMYSHADSKE